MILNCTQADHQSQIIIGTCIDKKCRHSRPYCNSCIQYHSNHLNKLVSLEFINDWVTKRFKIIEEIHSYILEIQSQIQAIKEFIQPILQISQTDLYGLSLNQLDRLIKNLSQFKKTEGIIIDQLKLTIKFLNEQGKKWKKLQQKHEELSFISINQTQTIEKFVIIQQQEEKNQHIILENLSETINYTQEQSISKQLQKTNKNIPMLFKFSNNPIPLTGIHSVSIKINNINNILGIGACHEDMLINPTFILKQSNSYGCVSKNWKNTYFDLFHLQLPKTGNKIYMLSNQGQSFTNLQMNNKTMFTIEENDIICIEVNTYEKQIIWKNNNKNLIYYEDIYISDSIYFLFICFEETDFDVLQ